jgi:hypothetical protein
MKTFDTNDLITWVNCDKAIVGNKYYFSNTLYGIQFRIKNNSIHTLIRVDEGLIDTPFVFENDVGECYSACALPVESVIEKNTYRPCKTIREFYELVFNRKSKADTEFYINELLGVNIHFRNKETGTEYFTTISTITKDINDYVKVVVSPKGYLSFTDLFNKYEIEVEGEFRAFGVTDET